ncbi:MAG TPA: circadian clock protein KaiC [Candidatus Thermoplasmatota archaeon]|nr:circadian clock protein KaiC [Candidatus Thermoplasmatota archaeon]
MVSRARRRSDTAALGGIQKAPTGIVGFDEITGGGLPRGRNTIVCGGPGCGKTLFAVEFLVRGARDFGEPGVFLSFEESPADLTENVASLGFDLDGLVRKGQLAIDQVILDRFEIDEAGEFDLEALFLRIGHAIRSVGAKRVALDTLEALFSGLPNPLAVRSELRRLFGWLKDQGVTTVVTAERGESMLTRNGLEEYVSDCVIVLDQRLENESVTRRLQILKYRGSGHQSNEFPFMIDRQGFSVIPITASRLDHPAPARHLSSGVPRLDAMIGGKGPFRGSSILVSGPAGTGKSTIAASFIDAACRRGERAIYFSFEESPATLIRDLKSVGLSMGSWVDRGLLRFESARVTASGLQRHVARMTAAVRSFRPTVAVIDPISSFGAITDARRAKNLVTQVTDMLHAEKVTAIMTYLTDHHGADSTAMGISSTIDTWVLLRDHEAKGIRGRSLCVVKARGMPNSDEVREYSITSKGIEVGRLFDGSASSTSDDPETIARGFPRAKTRRRQGSPTRRRSPLR